MARSRTTIQPGQRLALKHGLYSRLSQPEIEERLPAIRARLEAELAQNPIPLQVVDEAVKRRYCWLVSTAEIWEEFFDRMGGPFGESGKAREGYGSLLQTYDRIEKYGRMMGIGALPRAQTAQLQANANLNQVEVNRAQERLRQRQALRLIEGTS